RRMKRIDAVLIARDVILVFEFKRAIADGTAYWQVWDYALDLVDFHKPSRDQTVIPAVVADTTVRWLAPTACDGRVLRPRFSTPTLLAENIVIWFREATRL